MSFPRYPEYKYSGVEWLGEVPAHWLVTSLKQGFAVCLGKMLKPDATSPDDEYLPYLRAANIQWSGVDVTDVKSMWFSPWERQQLLLQRGDLLVSEGGDVGRSAVWEGELEACYFQNSVNRIRPRGKNSTKYAYYWMSVLKEKGFIDVLCNKSTIAHFTAEKVQAVPMVFPPFSEQEAVCNFLDGEVLKIDGLISEQEKLIALLKEKRQAVISHAVTKGLDPNVPMKDSGIEWIGAVPAHWEIVPIKWLSSVQRGASPRPIDDPKFFDDNGEYAWVRISDVSSSNGYLFETDQRLSDIGSGLSVRLLPGDLFISIAGTVGKPCISKIKACIHDGFVYFPRLAIDPEFLFRVFEVGTCYLGLGKFGTQLNLNTDTIGSIRVAMPPTEEIQGILKSIVLETHRLDQLIDEANIGVALLQERRRTIISAAVTGKIDVRQHNSKAVA